MTLKFRGEQESMYLCDTKGVWKLILFMTQRNAKFDDGYSLV